jgi:DNA (cytosine-5)-methyltransferase 1
MTAAQKRPSRHATESDRPLLIDLFCKAGGAGRGYDEAGFDVIGVDIEPQPNYPFRFVQADALAFLDRMLAGGTWDWIGPGIIDAYHGSPPCQDYSTTRSLHTAEYPRLIAPTRERLLALGKPYVIENVAGARSDMLSPFTLCGSSFGLGVWRHRIFETSFDIGLIPPCAHYLVPEPIDVTGTGGRRLDPRSGTRHAGGGDSRKPLNLAHAREVMGIDWMTRRELSEAIPPAYTRFIGRQLLAVIAERAAA